MGVDATDRPVPAGVLADAAAVGPYFAIQRRDDGAWLSLRALVDDPALLTGRVDRAEAFLAARVRKPVDRRACASIDALGIVSRLVSPALAIACLGGVVPRLALDEVWWQVVEGGPVPIALDRTSGYGAADAESVADAFVTAVLEPVVLPMIEAYRATMHVSSQVLGGNVASALAGAAGMLHRGGGAMPVDATDVVAVLLDRGPLAGSGRYDQPAELAPGRFFVRHNCCLFYRVPGGGRCGDCVLVPEPARLDGWRRSVIQAGTGSSA